MDIKITDGDWATNECGMPIILSDETEILQRAFLRLRIPKGAFLHAPELGSRFSEISPNNRENANRLAFLFAQQALAPLAPKIIVGGAQVDFGEKTTITITATTDTKKEVKFII